jgi:hypothetical protein
VRRHAFYIASLNRQAGDRYLAQQLEIQAATMRRRGVDEERIEEERRNLETAIRVALWNLVQRQPGGAA